MSKAKTKEQYMDDLINKNPQTIIVGEYINARTPTLHRCLIHGNEWNISPDNALKGKQCPDCAKSKMGKARKKSHDEYISQLKKLSYEIVPLEQYNGSKHKIIHYCKIHDYSWSVRPEDVLNGKGCPKCRSDKLRQRKLKSHDQYCSELKSIAPHLIVLESYIDCETPILHFCKKHSIEWKICPANALNGKGCPSCKSEKIHDKLAKTPAQYQQEVQDNYPYIKVMGRYRNNSTPISHKCLIHDIEWDAAPSAILTGEGCKQCGKEKLRKSKLLVDSEYNRKLSHNCPNIVCLSNYKGATVPIWHYCIKHKYAWLIKPTYVLHNKQCPLCTESHGEQDIRRWLEKHNISYIPQKRFEDCIDSRKLPFDFYLPKFTVAIEYDGEQHFMAKDCFGGDKQFQIQKKHDDIKNDYCKTHGITLLRISYYDDIEGTLNTFFNTVLYNG